MGGAGGRAARDSGTRRRVAIAGKRYAPAPRARLKPPAVACCRIRQAPTVPLPSGYSLAMTSKPAPGRAPLPHYLRRSERLTVLLRESELDDIRTLAAAWGCTASTAAWCLIKGQLATLRDDRRATGQGSKT